MFHDYADDVEAEEDVLADGYQMLEELGSGSFGVVYKAIEKATGEIVAVKCVDLESSEEDITDIQAEIAVLSSCASPYVTQYKTAFLRGQKLWIVMEYLGGGSCQDLLKPGVFNEAQIAIVCRELLLGLQYLHASGKLHRDIKAANVLLANNGTVKLADFGVAAQLTNIKSLRNTFVGTPFWMAPEVIQQAGHDFKADIWSLGITAMEMINGEPPHASTHPMKVLFLIPKNSAPRLEGNQYSKEFKDFVASCLVKDPDNRPSAKDLLKHKFIRHAGKMEALQELIIRRQEWEAGRENGSSIRYYAETMRSLPKPQPIEDDWVFDTIKPGGTVQAKESPKYRTQTWKTQKRRRVEIDQDAVSMMENLSISTTTPTRSESDQELCSTMRRVSVERIQPQQSPSLRRSSTRKRISSGQYKQQKQPLGVNMSFGNSPSTVRQFRRVSPNADNENIDPAHHQSSPSKQAQSRPQQSQPELTHTDPDRSSMPPPPAPRIPPGFSSLSVSISSLASTNTSISISSLPSTSSSASKEAYLGSHLYSSAIGLTCQDVLNHTASSEKREAVARVAEAFSELEMVDPEGVYHIMKGILEKMEHDKVMEGLLPKSIETAAISQASTLHEHHDAQSQPQSQPSTPQRGPPSAAKLVLAQNNPHLKSHRRRQSAQVVEKVASHASSTMEGEQRREEWELEKLMPGGLGLGGLEHTRVLADVLFERWCGGLRERWGVGM